MENELSSYVNKLCADFNLEFREKSSTNYRINTDRASGISIFIDIETSDKFSFYFMTSVYDDFYPGDRTDAHLVLSLMFSIYLRLSDIKLSVSLFDIGHGFVENELSGRYVIPRQISYNNEIDLKERIYILLQTVSNWRSIFWNIVGCPCNDCLEKENLITYHDNFFIINNNRDAFIDYNLKNTVENIYGSVFESNYGSRFMPKYNFYYDMENDVTVIKSIELSNYFEELLKEFHFSPTKISGLNGDLIIDDKLFNFIDKKAKKEIKKLRKKLLNNKIQLPIIPMENMLVALANPYVLALGKQSGFSEYKTERELVRNRHNLESEVLFPIPTFIWEDKVCPEQFENLIKSLLEREHYIKRVRKPAPINQGDKGRDLIVEWVLLDEKVISKNHPPLKTIKVVGQCKTSIKTIGKNKVIDIRDTVETHNSSGYFLAVNTQISASLTEKLESLRDKNIWTNWWNRDDIELRLTKNQDLISKFPKVLKVKHKVKFVKKD